jgi:RNA polymerase sigma factor (sigma-70 family)
MPDIRRLGRRQADCWLKSSHRHHHNSQWQKRSMTQRAEMTAIMQPDRRHYFNLFRFPPFRLRRTASNDIVLHGIVMDEGDLIPTRATLIQRLKSWQDQASWQDFFDAYWKLIYNVARKGGLTGEEAEDVVQETMISVAKHMPTFKYDPGIGSFKAWLLNMTRWRITDQLRNRKSSDTHRSSSEYRAPGAPAPEEVIDPSSNDLDAFWNAEWENNLLAAAITKVKRRLDPQKYQVFDLCVNKGWKAGKVAEAYGISADQVYLIKHRVTEMIKVEVNRLKKEIT